MSSDELVDMVYRYARSACRYTPLDYRDVAHSVIVSQLVRYRLGKIRYAKTYIYLATKCMVASMLKASVLAVDPMAIDAAVCYDLDAGMDVELVCSRITKRECAILDMTIRGFTRSEIAVELNMTRSGVNVVWHRMVHRLRCEL